MRDSPRVARLSLWKLALAVLASLSWAAPGELRAESSRDAGTAPILSAIETLESGSDAKCYSSASRFEDFLYGTPLGDDARHAEGEEQTLKDLATNRSYRVLQGVGIVPEPDAVAGLSDARSETTRSELADTAR